ncbi:MAG: hypothetical protein RR835_10310 [Peptostreptococcaceae bacterium]
MNKEQFNKLNVKSQIKYFNELLKKFDSISQVCKQIGIAPSTVKDRFKSNRYYFDADTKQYLEVVEIVSNTEDYDNNTNSYKRNEIIENKSMTNVVPGNGNNGLVLNNERLRALEFITLNLNKLENIVNNVDDISRNTKYDYIKIDIPDAENIRTTIKVNAEVWSLFSELATKNKQFDKQDLLSQALLDFCNKHMK